MKALINVGMYIIAVGLIVALVIMSMHFIERGYSFKDLIELIKALPKLIKIDFTPSQSSTKKGLGRFIRIEHPDGFREKGFFLSSREGYRVGDTVELKFEIYSKDRSTITLFTEKWKSLFLNIGPEDLIVSSPNFSEKIKAHTFFSGDETVEEVMIDTMQPYNLTVKGTVLASDDPANVIFDFGNYGRFEMVRASMYQMSGRWRPIKPDLLDLFTNKEYTNTVTISLIGG